MINIIKLIRQNLNKNCGELFGFVKEKNQLIKLIQNGFKNGVSDSILIIGKKGTGKTHLIRSVLEDLELDDDFSKKMHCVRLNGLIQVDDRMAIKSIGDQVKVSFEDDEHEVFSSQRINDKLHHILRVMTSGAGSDISLLFIIEEFDLFLQNRNQMLIYNLLNCASSVATPICVIGITSRLDVVELMEKRVTSRFSRCHINLTTYTKDFETYLATAKRLLTVTSSDTSFKSITNKWNKHVDVFFDDTKVQSILEQNYLMSNTISRLKIILIGLVCRLSENQITLKVEDLEDTWRRITVDYKIEILKGLSQMEFIFVAVMVICAEIKEGDINFELVYKDYLSFCYDNKIKPLEKNSMRKCLDNLINLQLVGVKKVVNVSVNYQALKCYVQHWDVNECIKVRPTCSPLENYMAAKQT